MLHGRLLLAIAWLAVMAAGAPAGSTRQYAPNFWVALCKTNKYSITRKVVQAAGMVGYLRDGRRPATFFPPDDIAWRQILSRGDLGISVEELLLPSNKALLREWVRSIVVPSKRIWTPQWPKWPKKDWYQTAQPGHKIGLEMDDGGSRPGDIFDVDGTDDDAELIPKSQLINLRVGSGVMHSLDDVPTWTGWRKAVLRNVAKARKHRG